MHAEIVVTGVVQGVGYRFFVIQKARELNMKGYVQNLPDGNVLVVAEESRGLLNDFIEQLKIGPLSAHVTDIHIKWSEENKGFEKFEVRS